MIYPLLLTATLLAETRHIDLGPGNWIEAKIVDGKIQGRIEAFAHYRKFHEAVFESRDDSLATGLGKEALGSRRDYGADGTSTSWWDSTSSGYVQTFHKRDRQVGYTQTERYEGGFLRSLVVNRKDGWSMDCSFDSEVWINFDEVFLAYVQKPGMIFNPYQPYAFETGACIQKGTDGSGVENRYWPDSSLQVFYGPGGKKKSASRCLLPAPSLFKPCKQSLKQEWFDNGRLSLSEESLGKDLVKHVRYFESGKVSHEMFLRKGKLDSILTYWREDGTLEEQVVFRNGREIDTVHYDSSGTRVEKASAPKP